MDETIIEAPKVDFFIKLASEADMPTAFADFYRQDYKTKPPVSEAKILWQYEMTDAEYETYQAYVDNEIEQESAYSHMLDSFPSTATEYLISGGTVTGYEPAVYDIQYDENGNEILDPDGEPYLVTHTHDYAIDVVGVIHEPTGNMLTDDEGNEYPETAPVDGWHVNVRLVGDAMRETVEALDALYGVVPNSPSRVFL